MERGSRPSRATNKNAFWDAGQPPATDDPRCVIQTKDACNKAVWRVETPEKMSSFVCKKAWENPPTNILIETCAVSDENDKNDCEDPRKCDPDYLHGKQLCDIAGTSSGKIENQCVPVGPVKFR